ncbi:MAG: dihydroorotate dehydrogenase-like protein [Cyclobacteriaceae bacterium]|nr:dihydroorotate dehydrogenase-like protein [Cyclobacteriaceae bacterium]
MSLETSYLGLKLKNPVIAGSSSLTGKIEKIQEMADHGIGGIVLKSLYEEQIMADLEKLIEQEEMYFWYPEATEYVNQLAKNEGISQYLQLIRETKKACQMPVIASINCITAGAWTHIAKNIEDAGADAIELNIAIFPANQTVTSLEIENEYIQIVHKVVNEVKIPVSVKIGFYFTNLPAIVSHLSEAGAKGIVLFNRFYRPDIDINKIELTTPNVFSASEESAITLRWIGLLSEKFTTNIIASTGIYRYDHAVKQILAGANAVQICSVLYKYGSKAISQITDGIDIWMKEKGFKSIEDFRGLVNRKSVNTMQWERIHFMMRSNEQMVKPVKWQADE